MFIRAYIKDKQNGQKTLFYFGVIFLMAAMIYFIFKAIYYGLYCKYGDTYEIVLLVFIWHEHMTCKSTKWYQMDSSAKTYGRDGHGWIAGGAH